MQFSGKTWVIDRLPFHYWDRIPIREILELPLNNNIIFSLQWNLPIPVFTLSPTFSWDIVIHFPFSRDSLAVAGKHPEGPRVQSLQRRTPGVLAHVSPHSQPQSLQTHLYAAIEKILPHSQLTHLHEWQLPPYPAGGRVQGQWLHQQLSTLSFSNPQLRHTHSPAWPGQN